MSIVTTVALVALSVAATLFLARLARGSSLADRIVALDGLLVIVASGLAVHAARTRDGTFLDLHVVAALLGFVSTLTVARFIERRGTNP